MEVELAAEVEAVTTSSRGWVSGVRTKGGRGEPITIEPTGIDWHPGAAPFSLIKKSETHIRLGHFFGFFVFDKFHGKAYSL